MSRRLNTALVALVTLVVVALGFAALVRFTPVNITIGDSSSAVSASAPSNAPAPSVSPRSVSPTAEQPVPVVRTTPTEDTLAIAGFIPVKVQLLSNKPANIVLAEDVLLPLHETLNDYLHTGQPGVPNAITQNYLNDTALQPAVRAYKLKAWSLPKTKGYVVYTDLLTKKAVLVTFTLADFQPMAYVGIEGATARQLAHPSFRAQLSDRLTSGLVLGGGFNTLDPFTDGVVGAAGLG